MKNGVRQSVTMDCQNYSVQFYRRQWRNWHLFIDQISCVDEVRIIISDLYVVGNKLNVCIYLTFSPLHYESKQPVLSSQ